MLSAFVKESRLVASVVVLCGYQIRVRVAPMEWSRVDTTDYTNEKQIDFFGTRALIMSIWMVDSCD